MLLTRSDIEARAETISSGLTDAQRLAVGLELIRSVKSQERWQQVRIVANEAQLHSARLCMDGFLPAHERRLQINPSVTTHENQRRDAEPPRHSRARAVLAKLREIDEFVDNSIIGDLIGAAALATILIVGLFWGYLQ
ncbi:hypothetical protein TG4357_03352 [Thalassovita gelatinovora]|uniref:Uncharacterized protein n=1 Tax=Thalassovita gelatinovora TaxID=53501 RepID=A0A0P1FJ51_THAGE|nr:hypothetical protein [Thalassovita gelatinovora]QIZ81592.1 hypothetical protein HFZ77_14450 [Thalassovita gelatinovora]CUH68033.1 hypothetical protein TG4357_03352 [Thalassovita gelatinovora]SEQ27926.1 hypothetical protein SAMN04488043_104223 [Thalassovita gelatinovora]